MSSHSIPQRAARLRADEQAFTNNAFGADGDTGDSADDMPLCNGWFDSSFELRRGLDVIEWLLPDPKPLEPPQ
jgi:hypothetical protein